MFRPIFNLPEGVIGFSAVGKLSSEDYRKVLIPEMEAKIAEGHKLRFLFLAGPDFDGWELGVTPLDDTMFGMRHFFDFERIAFVSDNAAFRALVQGMSVLMPMAVRTYLVSDLEQAKAWLAA
jgi:hypothetical protein